MTRPDGNVLAFHGADDGKPKRRDTPIGPHLPATIARLQEIAALSGDHLVTGGPVHPDHHLLDLCVAALDLVRQAEEVMVIYQRTIRVAARTNKRADAQ